MRLRAIARCLGAHSSSSHASDCRICPDLTLWSVDRLTLAIVLLQWRRAQRQRAEFARQVSVLKRILERQAELTGQDAISGAQAGEAAEEPERSAAEAPAAAAVPPGAALQAGSAAALQGGPCMLWKSAFMLCTERCRAMHV
jgi:hypothetical protein